MIPEYVDKNSEEKGHKFIVKCCMNALDEIRKGFLQLALQRMIPMKNIFAYNLLLIVRCCKRMGRLLRVDLKFCNSN